MGQINYTYVFIIVKSLERRQIFAEEKTVKNVKKKKVNIS